LLTPVGISAFRGVPTDADDLDSAVPGEVLHVDCYAPCDNSFYELHRTLIRIIADLIHKLIKSNKDLIKSTPDKSPILGTYTNTVRWFYRQTD
jgi:hypothetical protein